MKRLLCILTIITTVLCGCKGEALPMEDVTETRSALPIVYSLPEGAVKVDEYEFRDTVVGLYRGENGYYIEFKDNAYTYLDLTGGYEIEELIYSRKIRDRDFSQHLFLLDIENGNYRMTTVRNEQYTDSCEITAHTLGEDEIIRQGDYTHILAARARGEQVQPHKL